MQLIVIRILYVLSSFMSKNNDEKVLLPHFTVEEIDAQRSSTSFPKFIRYWWKGDSHPSLSDAIACVPTTEQCTASS